MKNLKMILAALALVALGFAICKFVDRRHENVKTQFSNRGVNSMGASA